MKETKKWFVVICTQWARSDRGLGHVIERRMGTDHRRLAVIFSDLSSCSFWLAAPRPPRRGEFRGLRRPIGGWMDRDRRLEFRLVTDGWKRESFLRLILQIGRSGAERWLCDSDYRRQLYIVQWIYIMDEFVWKDECGESVHIIVAWCDLSVWYISWQKKERMRTSMVCMWWGRSLNASMTDEIESYITLYVFHNLY